MERKYRAIGIEVSNTTVFVKNTSFKDKCDGLLKKILKLKILLNSLRKPPISITHKVGEWL
jgi:hypothetical protein